MEFEPPLIESIKDVLPIIKDNKAFAVVEKDWYTVIDYRYMSDDLFKNPIERECRGLKFDSKTGLILARPFHKFHNLNERPAFSTANVNLARPHTILEKLDGSMVHTCATSMGVYLMTRMGITDVSKQADAFMTRNSIKYGKLINTLSVDHYTYIFEYIGPSNKIVLDYKEEQLVLTAIRHNQNGTYIFHDELQKIGMSCGVPVVGKAIDPEHEGKLTINQLNDSVKLASGAEGVVVRFDTGEMVKIKADEYVRKHRAKDLTSKMHHIVTMIMEGTIDDVYPQLENQYADRIKDFAKDVQKGLNMWADRYKEYVDTHKSKTQKEFALHIQSQVDAVHHKILYKVRAGDDPHEVVKQVVLKAAKIDADIRALFKEYIIAPLNMVGLDYGEKEE